MVAIFEEILIGLDPSPNRIWPLHTLIDKEAPASSWRTEVKKRPTSLSLWDHHGMSVLSLSVAKCPWRHLFYFIAPHDASLPMLIVTAAGSVFGIPAVASVAGTGTTHMIFVTALEYERDEVRRMIVFRSCVV
jgi:hypothetical protein